MNENRKKQIVNKRNRTGNKGKARKMGEVNRKMWKHDF
jgi:hypothetical protein